MRGRKNAPEASSGATFPGYANVGELASGAFATVYRAVELGTGRPVALKVLRVADASPHLVEVFEKELGALALLSNHPNVTTLYGTFSTPEGRPVLVLELCRESLAHRVRQSGPLSAGEVVQVGIKIAGALETAHRSGLLHRDMKPQNILVSQFDEPVLADFGVATLQAQAQSTEGVFGFTTLHAPPEALEGLPLSPSADIYGLASSMYQLLVGRGPFSSYEGEAPASVILRILRDPAPRPLATDVPVALADLMENALAKDPGKRPQTAGAFAEALREIEALAGWAQTPYVVWGAAQAVEVPAENGPAPAALSPAAARLSQLLQAESAGIHRLADPAAPVTSAAPAARAAATEVVPPAPAVSPPAKTPKPVLLLPKRTTGQPVPPGTRSVIAPPSQGRNVLTPLPATAHARVMPPAETGPPVSFWQTPSAGAEGAARDRQWPLSPVAAQATGPDLADPRFGRSESTGRRPLEQAGATRRLSGSVPGPSVAQVTSPRKEALVLAWVFVGAVVLAGGLGWAAFAHLL